MKKIKLNADQTNDLFALMNFFKDGELIKIEQSKKDLKCLYLTFGAITNNTFKRRIKNFNFIHRKDIKFEEIVQS
jgi:hypothetical protein